MTSQRKEGGGVKLKNIWRGWNHPTKIAILIKIAIEDFLQILVEIAMFCELLHWKWMGSCYRESSSMWLTWNNICCVAFWQQPYLIRSQEIFLSFPVPMHYYQLSFLFLFLFGHAGRLNALESNTHYGVFLILLFFSFQRTKT